MSTWSKPPGRDSSKPPCRHSRESGIQKHLISGIPTRPRPLPGLAEMTFELVRILGDTALVFPELLEKTALVEFLEQ